MNFKSGLYKPFMAISNLLWQPYYVFMNPFGVDFLLYLHFIRIEERMNINLFQNFLSPAHITILKEGFVRKVKLIHNQ